MTVTLDIDMTAGYLTATAPAVYKWDTGILLVLHGIQDTHGMLTQYILPDGMTVSRLAAYSDGSLITQIPDALMMYDVKTNYEINAFLTDGATEYHVTIPVTYRDKPTDFIPSDTNQQIIKEVISQSQSLLSTARTLLESAKTYKEQMELLNVTLAVGKVETLPAGGQASAVLDKTNGNYKINFKIPKGEKGEKGDPFKYSDFTSDQLDGLYTAVVDKIKPETTTLSAGSQATAKMTKKDGEYTLSLGIPKGDKGEKGDSITLKVGKTMNLAAGAAATAEMTSNGNEYTLSFGIPKGIQGDKGEKGDKFQYSDFTSTQLSTMYDAVAARLKQAISDGDITAYGS